MEELLKIRITLASKQKQMDVSTLERIAPSQIVHEIMSTLGVVLRAAPLPDVIDKVTIVATYAEFVISYPAVLAYQQSLATSINDLASVLESIGGTALAVKTWSLSPLKQEYGRGRLANRYKPRPD